MGAILSKGKQVKGWNNTGHFICIWDFARFLMSFTELLLATKARKKTTLHFVVSIVLTDSLAPLGTGASAGNVMSNVWEGHCMGRAL